MKGLIERFRRRVHYAKRESGGDNHSLVSSSNEIQARPVSQEPLPSIVQSEKNPPMIGYEPLDPSSQQIRLLQIKVLGKATSYSFKTEDLASNPSYIALSYAWGNPNPDRDRWILVGSQRLLIRENLYDFLKSLRGFAVFTFWIDQICINQADVLEQNHQVQFMSRIYSCASKVIVWLGIASEKSNSAMRKIRKSNETVNVLMGFDEAPAVKALFQREYWRRLWVVQEIILARRIVVKCGTLSVDWSCLQVFFQSPSVVRSALGSRHDFDREDGEIDSYAEQIILTQDSWGENGAERLSYVLTTFSTWSCSNPRDKVYGLLGLVDKDNRVAVDYQKSVKDIFVDVLRKVIVDEAFMSQRSQVDFAKTLGKSLGLNDLDINGVIRSELQLDYHSELDYDTDVRDSIVQRVKLMASNR